MKMRTEHVADLTSAILSCRELCGDERETIREYLSENGFEPGSISAPIIADEARIEANRQWDQWRRDAGVKAIAGKKP